MRVAGGDRAAGDHLGIDAALGVTKPSHQRLRNGEIACGGVGIDVDRSAAVDALHHLEPDVADRERPIEQVELMPGRPALDIEVARGSAADEPAGPTMFSMARTLARLMIETTSSGDVRKAVAVARSTFGGPLIAAKGGREKVFDRGAALGRLEVASAATSPL